MENARLLELHIERVRERGIAGNIYKGRVVRVLPGMQAAFVDIGLEKAAFLHASDSPAQRRRVRAERAALEATTPRRRPAGAATTALAPPARRPRALPPIEERLQKGQDILVQVTKEPIGTKGARVTANISLPGRYLVYMPLSQHIGISRRIEDGGARAPARDRRGGARRTRAASSSAPPARA